MRNLNAKVGNLPEQLAVGPHGLGTVTTGGTTLWPDKHLLFMQHDVSKTHTETVDNAKPERRQQKPNRLCHGGVSK